MKQLLAIIALVFLVGCGTSDRDWECSNHNPPHVTNSPDMTAKKYGCKDFIEHNRSGHVKLGIGVDRLVQVTHGYYEGCKGTVVDVDVHGCFWVDTVCDGQERGRLMFTQDFLKRIRR